MSRRQCGRRPERSIMTVPARNRPQAERSLRPVHGSCGPTWTIEKAESSMSDPQPRQQLTRMITGYWTSRAIYVAAKLRIADHLKDGPRAAEELAAEARAAPR